MSSTMSRSPEVFPNWLFGVGVALLGHCAMMFSKSLVSHLPRLTTILRIVFAGPVSFLTCDEVQDVGCSARELSPDRQELSSGTDLDIFYDFPSLP